MSQKGFVNLLYIFITLIVLAAAVGYLYFSNEPQGINLGLTSSGKSDNDFIDPTDLNVFNTIYADISKESNEKKFENLYKYLFEDSKEDVNPSQFSDTIKDFFDIAQIVKVTYKLNGIERKDNLALVDRTIEYCFDKDCKDKKSERSKIKWHWENNKWTTATEAPLCIRNQSKPSNDNLIDNSVNISESNIKISQVIDCSTFPMYWYINSNRGIEDLDDMVRHINPEDSQRVVNAIQSGLKKYPSNFLKSNLKTVFVLGNLNFYGVKFGSTYSNSKVYLTGGPVLLGYTDEYIEGKLHHEFSSILFNKYRSIFPESEWLDANPADFVYGTGGSDAIKNNQSSEELDESQAKEGFLNSYGQASIEEDFNEFAQFILLGDKEVWDYANNNPKLKTKLSLFIKFYQAIDPHFTEEYFINLIK